jgi:hypothetical protein
LREFTSVLHFNIDETSELYIAVNFSPLGLKAASENKDDWLIWTDLQLTMELLRMSSLKEGTI